MIGARTDIRTLITGATGFLGSVVLAELLGRGHRCDVLVRDAAKAAPKLFDLLAAIGPGALVSANGRVSFVEGDLPDGLPAFLGARIDRVVHAAACTRFELNGDGDPYRTNAMGTAALLRWCERHRVREFHLISTAYSNGVLDRAVPERVLETHGRFRNAYEHSKWTAEQHVCAWGRTPGRSWTIVRPSIIVGDYATGHALKLNGLYIALRAFSRAAARAAGRRRGVRLEGAPDGTLNYVPVDYVARAIGHVVDTRWCRGRVFNLVHPSPRSNRWLLDQVQAFHGVEGGRFVSHGEWRESLPTLAERSLAAAMGPLRAYLDRSCEFERTNTALLEGDGLGACPMWDEASVRRVVAMAEGDPTMAGSCRAGDPAGVVAAFFDEFLPARLGGEPLAGMGDLSTSFRFVVDGVENGRWLCRVREGRLVGVWRGGSDAGDFTYRMDIDAFFDIVGAQVDPQDVFLEGRAHVEGNIERALKMGMILHQFNREHPYRVGAERPGERADA